MASFINYLSGKKCNNCQSDKVSIISKYRDENNITIKDSFYYCYNCEHTEYINSFPAERIGDDVTNNIAVPGRCNEC